MVYVNNDLSHSRKLSVVSGLPEFNIVDVKPEVHLYTEVEGFLVAILVSGCRPTSGSVGSLASESGVVENVGVATGISPI